MSREIKFRMWLPGINKMTYVHTLEELMNWGTKEWTNGTANFLQYTGLNDKNGKEIYEGDICKFDILGTEEKHNPFEALLKVIEWKHAAFGFRPLFPQLVHKDDREWEPFVREDGNTVWNTSYFEVIGNIYENPELIESAKRSVGRIIRFFNP